MVRCAADRDNTATKQTSCARTAYAGKEGHRTQRERFLAEMDRVVSWPRAM